MEISRNYIPKIGVAIIDEQHGRFVDLINDLHALPESELKTAVGRDLVEDLTDYAALHFETEAKIMGARDYPKRSAHLAEHARIAAELAAKAEDIVEGRESKAAFVMFLWQWLVAHTNLDDVELGQFLSRST